MHDTNVNESLTVYRYIIWYYNDQWYCVDHMALQSPRTTSTLSNAASKMSPMKLVSWAKTPNKEETMGEINRKMQRALEEALMKNIHLQQVMTNQYYILLYYYYICHCKTEVCIYVCMYNICMYICMYVCIYVCMYVCTVNPT